MFIVNFLMFRLAERNEELSTVEAPTSPFVKGKWHMILPTIFDYAFSGFISIKTNFNLCIKQTTLKYTLSQARQAIQKLL